MKILVAMSGGVDSSAAAALLCAQGFEIGGAMMRLTAGGEDSEADTACARAVCERLGIPFYIFDFTDTFECCVVEPFCRSYLACETPNPCVLCNRHLKFGAFLSEALRLGYDKIATGHYARTSIEDGEYRLRRAACAQKDQSYVLYGLNTRILSRTVFPLGDIDSKQSVRALAEKGGVAITKKGESQDICFIPDNDYAAFIKRRTGINAAPGNFVTPEGEVIGRHDGLYNYTVGQRRGLSVAAGKRIYVIRCDTLRNEVVLADEGLLYKKDVTCRELTFISGRPPGAEARLSAKTRYRAPDTPAALRLTSANEGVCSFDTPVRAPAPGQSIVFYDGDFVLGGGIIC